MRRVAIIGEHPDRPTEGIQVVTRAITRGLRDYGYQIELVEPKQLRMAIMRWVFRPPDCVLFTHGPGRGTVAASSVMRRLVQTKIIWVATRPDLHAVPAWLRSRRTAHGIVCNRVRPDLQRVARDAVFIEQYIGIDPERVSTGSSSENPWPELTDTGRFIVLHVGHLRPNRGLDLLASAKRALAEDIEIVVQASPMFEPDSDVVEDLVTSGVRIRRGYESDLGALYRAANLYAFPARPASEGAIELPLGVLEALASGTPVLTTPFGVLPTALGDAPGVTVANEDVFADVLGDLVRSPTPLDRPPGLPRDLEIGRTIDATRSLVEAICSKS